MDGVDALPHQDLAAGPNGDELACAGLQLEAGDENPRTAALDGIHEGLDGEGSDRSIEPPAFNPQLSPATASKRGRNSECAERCKPRFHTASVVSGLCPITAFGHFLPFRNHAGICR